ncbi:MAG: DegT/DnrJ/EryC1/StrS family aminotransferase [Gemmatimonadota bacterium]
MAVPLLDLVTQYNTIREEIEPALRAVIERQGFVMGPEIPALEEALAELMGLKRGIACASGTDALLLPLRALDLAPGDEVIAPAFTFFATAGAIHNAGGRPVFVDVEPGTLNIAAEAIEAAITPKTRAIVVVHLFGQMAAMESIAAIAARHGLAVIEDGAQSVGARRMIQGEWRTPGQLGTVATLSFFPTKNLGAWGDGGMILTDDIPLADRLARLRLHGGAKQYHHDEVGYNSRLDSLQAAVLLVKLRHLQQWNDARRANAEYYAEALGGLPQVTLPVVDPANEHIWHQYTIEAERRDELMAHLKAAGIGCAVYYPLPLHLQPCFAELGYRLGDLPVTEAAMLRVLSLPIYSELTQGQLDEVVTTVRRFYT